MEAGFTSFCLSLAIFCCVLGCKSQWNTLGFRKGLKGGVERVGFHAKVSSIFRENA